MKILVCIKQVPDMESKFKVAASGTWYDDQDLAWRMTSIMHPLETMTLDRVVWGGA